ncbi:hypothetical protein ATEIFO6365_0001095900 [Aspergillus terreus]|uniref:B30.2/SPRY domain-containing protein n=1 Tax=Aspergillus terreus TaxID=33178 RepID=A0A5M3YMK8_ASPTE|nr:hypothetical protein ATETN484_0001088000 [Aspergillus terreus]GFF12735.1 hypothetical protein ATEIFO6365_0001095900 [Aspergillus terreus]
MALKCLHYIALIDEKDYLASQQEIGKGGNSAYSFLEYAVKHWHQHYELAKKATKGSRGPLPEFNLYLRDEPLIRKWAHLFCSYAHPLKQSVWVDPMLVSVEIGCVDLVKELLNSSPRASVILNLALEIAIGNGDGELVGLFLERGAKSTDVLHLIALSGSLTMLLRFPHVKADLASVGTHGLTPLHFACKGGSREMVYTLIENGADVNVGGQKTGSTPLHLACQYGHGDVISLLLEKGADPNAKDETKLTPLHAATMWQQPLAVRVLVESAVSVDYNTTALHVAAGTGRLDIFKLILHHCTQTKRPETEDDTVTVVLSTRDETGATPLHRAASGGHTEVVRALLSLEKDSGSRAVLGLDDSGCLPLHLAARSGHLDVVNCLLEQGEASTQLLTEGTGNYAIHWAVLGGHVDVVKRLCEAHENGDVPLGLFCGEDSGSPLHLAVKGHQVDMVKHLLSSGATPNIMDANNATPLFYACQNGHLKIVDLLLGYEATIDTPNNQDISPLLAATENKHPSVVQRLIEKQAQLNMQDKRGKTALMAACESGNVLVVRWLLDAGADVTATDEHGRQALHVAAEYAHKDILEALLELPNIDPCSRDSTRDTPLHLAVQSASADQIPSIDVLIKHRAQPDLENKYHESPVDLAKTEQVALILAKAACFGGSSESSSFQKRLLQVSAKKGWLEIIKDLHRNSSEVDITVRDEQSRSLYHLSAMHGQIDVIQYLLQAKIPGHGGTDASRRTPVSYAAEYGHLEAVKMLAEEAPESMNQSDKDGETPLSYAVKSRHIHIVEYLLDNKEAFSIRFGADDKEERATRTLYHLAAVGSNGSPEMVELLFAQDVPGYDGLDERKQSPMTYAAMYGNLEIARILRRMAPGSLNQADEDGKTPLFHAVEKGHVKLVEYLVGERVDLNVSEKKGGQTALHCAAQDGLEEMVQILLRSNAAKDAQDSIKRTPLYLAAFHGRVEVVSALINGKADPHLADEDGWQPVFVAYDNHQILEMLLDSGANIDAKTNGGLTALHGAALGYTESVILLLDRGANPLEMTEELWTPLHYAASNASDAAIITLLVDKIQEKRGNPDVRDHRGWTPLMIALAEGSHTAVETLLESGLFDVNNVSDEGQSMVDLAIDRSSRSFVELLVQYGVSSLSRQQVVRVLAWATGEKYDRLQKAAIDAALEKRPLESSQFDELFDIAVKHGNPRLIDFLFACEPTSERKDAHNWTLQQIHASFCLDTAGAGPDDNHLVPTRWSSDHQAGELIIIDKEAVGLAVRRDQGESPAAILADHPVPSLSRFYFEVEILKRSSDMLGIGFGHRDCDVNTMPGWRQNTWGYHADDGGFFHADGWRLVERSEWMYDTGDVIGCCIDLGQRKAFYTKNGLDIGPCFTAITGQVYPMIALGPGDWIVANFGQSTVPFHHSNGRDREYQADFEIVSESYRIDA